MEYLRGWRAMRQDPEWVGKLGIATLVALSGMCIPIVGQIVLMGWRVIMLRRAISGQDAPMPKMDFDIDYMIKLLSAGFKSFLAQILWSLPVIGLVFVSYCCMYGGMMLVVGGGVAAGDDGAAIGGIVSVLLMIVMLLVIVIGGFLLGMLMQVGVLRAEISDDINVSLRFGETFAMTKLLAKELIIGGIVMGLVSMCAFLVGLFTLYLGLLPAFVVVGVIQTYYQAELYKAYLQKGGQPLPLGPLAVEGGDVPLVAPLGAPQPQGGYPPPAQQGGGGWGPPPAQF